MKVISDPKKIQAICLKLKKKGKSIAFVPTMGYLHAGHMKLMYEAKKKADISVLSIFVNPTQFAPNEDLAKYPRDKKGDLAKAKACGVDFVFMPTPFNLYPENYETYVEVINATRQLCGASRPTHFRGVTTIVAKLFNIVQPDVALFGKKDFQQYAVIKKMVSDLNMPTKIIGVPTIREKDGLAMSSRNVYLSSDERKAALCLSRGLNKIKENVKAGITSIDQLLKIISAEINSESLARIDYVACMDAETIQPLKNYEKQKTLFAVAVFIGKTRLIDNIVV